MMGQDGESEGGVIRFTDEFALTVGLSATTPDRVNGFMEAIAASYWKKGLQCSIPCGPLG